MDKKYKAAGTTLVVLLCVSIGACALKQSNDSTQTDIVIDERPTPLLMHGSQDSQGVLLERSSQEVLLERSSQDSLQQKDSQGTLSTQSQQATQTCFISPSPGKVTVYVCGEVQIPGVYSLDEDKRIADAVEAAGGLSTNAAADWVNLAQKLTDGVKIYIPTVEETQNGMAQQKSAAGMLPKGVTDSGNEDDAKVDADCDALVNINTATKEELMTIKGVGESKAESIIEFRTANGPFKRIEDIMNITGIKEGMFNKIKDKITV